MKQLVSNLKEIKDLVICGLIGLFSFMPVLALVVTWLYWSGTGNTLGYLVKHIVHICIGFTIIFMVHKVLSILKLFLKEHFMVWFYWPTP
jgi:cell division protein FtsW